MSTLNFDPAPVMSSSHKLIHTPRRTMVRFWLRPCTIASPMPRPAPVTS